MQLRQLVHGNVESETHLLEGLLLQQRVALQDHARQLMALAHQFGLEQQVDQVAVRVETSSSCEDDDVLRGDAVQCQSQSAWLADHDGADLGVGEKKERSEFAVRVLLDQQRQQVATAVLFLQVGQFGIQVVLLVGHGDLVGCVEVLADLDTVLGDAVDQRHVSWLQEVHGSIQSCQLGVHCQRVVLADLRKRSVSLEACLIADIKINSVNTHGLVMAVHLSYYNGQVGGIASTAKGGPARFMLLKECDTRGTSNFSMGSTPQRNLSTSLPRTASMMFQPPGWLPMTLEMLYTQLAKMKQFSEYTPRSLWDLICLQLFSINLLLIELAQILFLKNFKQKNTPQEKMSTMMMNPNTQFVYPPNQPVSMGTCMNKIQTHPKILCPLFLEQTCSGATSGLYFDILHMDPESRSSGRIQYKINPIS